MDWTRIPPYQKLFIIAIILMLIYTGIARLAGIWLDAETVLFVKKILKYIVGLLFVGFGFLLYFRRKNPLPDPKGPEY